ncbi:MAG: hypothetical protein QOJ86_1547 [Bradyrhizobium sp.]|nr:hypothetical protein [Bradyrhizobium sp.]
MRDGGTRISLRSCGTSSAAARRTFVSISQPCVFLESPSTDYRTVCHNALPNVAVIAGTGGDKGGATQKMFFYCLIRIKTRFRHGNKRCDEGSFLEEKVS